MQCTSITSYGECITPSKWDFPNITRPFSIIYYALGGSAYYKIDGEERRFEKDHLYILPANKVFSLREESEDKFYSVYIHAFTSPEISSVIDVDVRDDAFLFDLLCMMRRYIHDKEGVYTLKLTETLISYVFERTKNREEPLCVKVKEYIDLNFVSVFKRSDLSGKFNYSSSHIVKIFKSQYNITPRQYAKQLIMHESALLLQKGMSVCEISARLQFSSPENFSRFFKSCYACAPSEYARRFGDFPL